MRHRSLALPHTTTTSTNRLVASRSSRSQRPHVEHIVKRLALWLRYHDELGDRRALVAVAVDGSLAMHAVDLHAVIERSSRLGVAVRHDDVGVSSLQRAH